MRDPSTEVRLYSVLDQGSTVEVPHGTSRVGLYLIRTRRGFTVLHADGLMC